jgi:hypothetical protein
MTMSARVFVHHRVPCPGAARLAEVGPEKGWEFDERCD